MTPYLSPLGPDELRGAGIPAPWAYGIQDRVRFGEIDVLGHVNNTVYLKWFETLRLNYFRDLVTPRIPSKQTIVLRNVGVDFLAEIMPDESYIVVGRTVEMRRTSFSQHYGVYVSGQLRGTGSAVIVTLGDDRRKAPIADDLRAVLIDIDQPGQL